MLAPKRAHCLPFLMTSQIDSWLVITDPAERPGGRPHQPPWTLLDTQTGYTGFIRATDCNEILKAGIQKFVLWLDME